MAKLQDAITVARGYLQDTLSPLRYSDVDLTQYGNDALFLLAEARPELFTHVEDIRLVEGAQQRLTIDGSLGLMDILSNMIGDNVRHVDKPTLDRFRPGWGRDPAGFARQWFQQLGDKYVFFVYPPANDGDTVTVLHSIFLPYLIGAVVDTRLDPYMGIVADYIAGAAEARESEDAGPQRSAKFVQDFLGKIKR